jgi:Ni,Fe-hydrogenase I cytochrome b subunit
MFESALTTFIAPAGVGVLVLFIEYFVIRRTQASPLSNTIRNTVFLVILLAVTAGFAVYQMNQNRVKLAEIRELIREGVRSESVFYTAKEVK